MLWKKVNAEPPYWEQGRYAIYQDKSFVAINGIVYPLFYFRYPNSDPKHVGDYVTLEGAKEAALQHRMK